MDEVPFGHNKATSANIKYERSNAEDDRTGRVRGFARVLRVVRSLMARDQSDECGREGSESNLGSGVCVCDRRINVCRVKECGEGRTSIPCGHSS